MKEREGWREEVQREFNIYLLSVWSKQTTFTSLTQVNGYLQRRMAIKHKWEPIIQLRKQSQRMLVDKVMVSLVTTAGLWIKCKSDIILFSEVQVNIFNCWLIFTMDYSIAMWTEYKFNVSQLIFSFYSLHHDFFFYESCDHSSH